MLRALLLPTLLAAGCFLEPDEQLRPEACVADDFTGDGGACHPFGNSDNAIANHQFSVRQSGDSDGGCRTTPTALPFTDGGIFIEVLHAPAEGTLALQLDESPEPDLVIDSTVSPPMLRFGAFLFVDADYGHIPYDAGAMRWLRLRPDATNQVAIGEYSADGVHWIAIPAGPDTPSFTAASTVVEIVVTSTGTDDAHTAVVGELDACPDGVP